MFIYHLFAKELMEILVSSETPFTEIVYNLLLNESHDTITDDTLIWKIGNLKSMTPIFCAGFCQKQEKEGNRSPYGLKFHKSVAFEKSSKI